MLSVWQLQEIIEKLGIENWGSGYFSVNSKGDISCLPKGESSGSVSLPEIIADAKKQGVQTLQWWLSFSA